MKNTEQIAHWRSLLNIYRRNLAHYEAQAKAHGGVDLAPPITRHGIEEAQQQIADLEAKITRAGGQP